VRDFDRKTDASADAVEAFRSSSKEIAHKLIKSVDVAQIDKGAMSDRNPLILLIAGPRGEPGAIGL
jgi:hypothetical protein